jgi:hypothetical protein
MKRVNKHAVRHISMHNINSIKKVSRATIIIIAVSVLIIIASVYIIIVKPFKAEMSDFKIWVCNTADSLQSQSNACSKLTELKIVTKDECCKELKKCCIKS